MIRIKGKNIIVDLQPLFKVHLPDVSDLNLKSNFNSIWSSKHKQTLEEKLIELR